MITLSALDITTEVPHNSQRFAIMFNAVHGLPTGARMEISGLTMTDIMLAWKGLSNLNTLKGFGNSRYVTLARLHSSTETGETLEVIMCEHPPRLYENIGDSDELPDCFEGIGE